MTSVAVHTRPAPTNTAVTRQVIATLWPGDALTLVVAGLPLGAVVISKAPHHIFAETFVCTACILITWVVVRTRLDAHCAVADSVAQAIDIVPTSPFWVLGAQTEQTYLERAWTICSNDTLWLFICTTQTVISAYRAILAACLSAVAHTDTVITDSAPQTFRGIAARLCIHTVCVDTYPSLTQLLTITLYR